MRIIIVSFVVFFIDQITKYIAKTSLLLGQSVEVLGNFFRFTHIENSGMAFGIQVPNKLLFNTFSIIAALAILYYLYQIRNKNFIPKFALALIFGGAMGNLYDRISLGKVVDFFDFNIPDISMPSINLFLFTIPEFSLSRWPIFNIADVAVSIGMVLLIFTIFFQDGGLDPLTQSEDVESDSTESDIQQPLSSDTN